MTVVAFIINLYYNIQHNPGQLKINERNQKKRGSSLLSALCLSSSLMTSNSLEKDMRTLTWRFKSKANLQG